MHATAYAQRACVRPVATLLATAIALSALFAESAAASTAYSAASAQPRPIPWTGWNGRPIERPHKPVDRGSLASVSYPVDWRAGAVRYGTGYHNLGGSDRVREVQRRLTRLGYHTGPVDGLYGPLTRSSVQWFQIKHGLRPTGVVAATTLAILREPRALTRHGKAPAKHGHAPTAPQPLAAPSGAPAPPAAKPASTAAPAWLVPVLIAVLAAMLGLGALTLFRTRRRTHPRGEREHRPPMPVATAASTSRPSQEPPVLGYVSADDIRSARSHEAAIREACQRRGWPLAHLVRDTRTGQGRVLGRPGVSYALEQLNEGRASRLVVHELEQIARSVSELRVVLGWFMHVGVAFTALDVGLDTGTQAGRTAARALLAVTASEQARLAAKTRSQLAPAGAAPPAVQDHPDLAGRIREMRAQGMTLQAIADSLNEEGVATVRGGERWRPSSVQSVLGQKRTGEGRW